MAKIVKIFTDAIFILLIILLAAYFVLRFFGVAEIYKVQTGSMEDGIHAGDYILIYKKDKYNVGDVVTYKKDDYHVTHRIIKKKGNKVITKGDANNVEDSEINTSDIVGKVIYNGGCLNFVVDYKYALASGLLALYLFSCYFGEKEDIVVEDSQEFKMDNFLEEDSEKIDVSELEKSSEEVTFDDDLKNEGVSVNEDISTEEDTIEAAEIFEQVDDSEKNEPLEKKESHKEKSNSKKKNKKKK